MMKSFRLAPILLTLVCVGSVLWFVDISQTLALLRTVDIVTALSLAAVAIGSRVLRSIKWNLLLRSQGIRISVWYAIRLNWAGSFLAFWTPAGLGSDAYRVMALRAQRRTPAVISTLVIERYFGLLSVGLFWVLTMPLTFRYLWTASREITMLLSIVCGVCVLALLLLMVRAPYRRKARGWRRHLTQLVDELACYRKKRALLFVFFLLTIVELLSYIWINYLAAHALGIDVSFGFLVCAMPTVYLLLRLPISIHGLGFQEGALAYVLSVGGFDPAVGVAISLLQRLIEVVCFILPGALLAPWNATLSPDDETKVMGESRFSKV